MFIIGLKIITDSDLYNSIIISISSINITDADNSSRFISIKNGLELILKYPFGIGYNMTSTVYRMNYPFYNQSYVFSTLLVNWLELGVLGLFVYFVMFLPTISILIKKEKFYMDLVMGLSLLFIFVAQLSNGISLYKMQFIVLLLALSNIRYKKLKDSVLEENDL